MIDYNLHQHTLFSDGKELPESYAERAVKIGFTAIGYSEHSPLPFSNPFSLKEEEVDNYIHSIDSLRESFKDQLKIYRSLEMDFVPGLSEDFEYWKERCKVDYLIGSVHLVKPAAIDKLWFTDGPDFRVYDKGIEDFFQGDIKRAVKAFYHQTNQMIESQRFEIIGHFDKVKMHNGERFFSDDDKWYRDLIDETVSLIKAKGIIAEVNTRGLYKKRSDALFPDGYALQRVKDLGIPIILSSDAHQPYEINALFDSTVKYLLEMGFREVLEFANGNWQSRSLN